MTTADALQLMTLVSSESAEDVQRRMRRAFTRIRQLETGLGAQGAVRLAIYLEGAAKLFRAGMKAMAARALGRETALSELEEALDLFSALGDPMDW
jgi:hypothetical protein